MVKNAPGAGRGQKGPAEGPAVPCKGKMRPVAEKTHAFIPSHFSKNLESQGRSNKGGGGARAASSQQTKSSLAGSESLGVCWPHGCFCRAGSQQPRRILTQGGCRRLLAGRCDPRIHIWWPLASQELQRSELATRFVLCPPPPSGHTDSLGVAEEVLPEQPLPSGELTPYCPCRAAFPEGETCQRSAGLQGPGPPRARLFHEVPAAALPSGGAPAQDRERRGVSAVRVSPWSHGEPGRAQGQWVSSRCHQLH
ncbi:hypothetical protein Nmel_013161 [Mimus melanotis]